MPEHLCMVDEHVSSLYARGTRVDPPHVAYMLHANGLPPIERIPIASLEGRRFVRVVSWLSRHDTVRGARGERAGARDTITQSK
jgi:hypothetical protein